MTQRALQAGTTTQTRGRALFGLLDANGWGWASVKAAFWFIVIIFLLGYIPDRAYYFTVNRTMDLGILAWSPVNFCPEGNRSLPCPAPVGAVVPWDLSPEQVALPAPRTDGSAVQVGTKLLYVGGSDGTAATADVSVATTSGVGNFDAWTAGPALPEPRSDAAVVYSAGSIFAIGGFDAEGAPTDTVFVLTPDATTGELGEWQTAEEAELKLTLPEPRAGAAVVAAPDGLILVGGTNGTAPTKSVWHSVFNTNGELQAWAPEAELFTETTDAAAALLGDFLWVIGGTSASGPIATVQRAEFGTGETDAGKVVRVGVAGGATNLPAARTNLAGFTANGALYAIGGSDGTAVQRQLYWTVPDANGSIAEWKHLDVSDLPEGIQGAAPVVLGPDAVLIGGATAAGPTRDSARANIAPQEPFFQLGLVGATVPALKIDGEIGQQLGYLNANTVGIINFAILLVIGWIFAHRQQIKDWRERRRRVR